MDSYCSLKDGSVKVILVLHDRYYRYYWYYKYDRYFAAELIL